MQQDIGFEGTTDAMTIFDVGTRPAGVHFVRPVYAQQQAGAEEGNQGRRFELVPGRFYEQADLLGRFATPAFDPFLAGITKIRGIDFANTIIAQARARLDSARSGLVMDHSQRQFKLLLFAGIAIVGEPHYFPFMLVLDHI